MKVYAKSQYERQDCKNCWGCPMTIFIEGSLLGLSIVPRGLKGNMSLDSLKSHSIGGVVEWTELTEVSQGPRYQPDQESQFPVVWASSDMGTPMWCGTGWFRWGVVLGTPMWCGTGAGWFQCIVVLGGTDTWKPLQCITVLYHTYNMKRCARGTH